MTKSIHRAAMPYVEHCQAACLRYVAATAEGSPTRAQLAAEAAISNALMLLAVLDAGDVQIHPSPELAERLRAAAAQLDSAEGGDRVAAQ